MRDGDAVSLVALLDRWRYRTEGAEADFAADRSAIYGEFHFYRLKG